ncbi:hypothetical protein GCM10009528_01150 [Kineococcus aurantiacus]
MVERGGTGSPHAHDARGGGLAGQGHAGGSSGGGGAERDRVVEHGSHLLDWVVRPGVWTVRGAPRDSRGLGLTSPLHHPAVRGGKPSRVAPGRSEWRPVPDGNTMAGSAARRTVGRTTVAEEFPMPDFGDISEKASDAAIDKAGDAVDQKTGGDHADQVDKAQETVDHKIGE